MEQATDPKDPTLTLTNPNPLTLPLARSLTPTRRSSASTTRVWVSLEFDSSYRGLISVIGLGLVSRR